MRDFMPSADRNDPARGPHQETSVSYRTLVSLPFLLRDPVSGRGLAISVDAHEIYHNLVIEICH